MLGKLQWPTTYNKSPRSDYPRRSDDCAWLESTFFVSRTSLSRRSLTPATAVHLTISWWGAEPPLPHSTTPIHTHTFPHFTYEPFMLFFFSSLMKRRIHNPPLVTRQRGVEFPTRFTTWQRTTESILTYCGYYWISYFGISVASGSLCPGSTGTLMHIRVHTLLREYIWLTLCHRQPERHQPPG